jgi:hypothetical protein
MSIFLCSFINFNLLVLLSFILVSLFYLNGTKSQLCFFYFDSFKYYTRNSIKLAFCA